MIEPLPVPTRVFHGEIVTSYARRHAANNFTTERDVQASVRHRGDGPTELEALWRQLGGLHHTAFTVPSHLGGTPVTERPLCLRCTRGHPARGRLPEVGFVCLRHRRWIGEGTQTDLASGFAEVLGAERRFRRLLVPRGVMIASLAMTAAGEAAREAVGGEGTLGAIRAYPEQIRVATVLSDTPLMWQVTDPELPATDRTEQLKAAIGKVTTLRDRSAQWRLHARLSHTLADAVRVRRQHTWTHREDSYLLSPLYFPETRTGTR